MTNINYNQNKSLDFDTKNCIILGSNGSGKSTLSKQIKRLNSNIELISEHRNLLIDQGSLRGQKDDAILSQLNLHLSNTGAWDNSFSSPNSIQADFNHNVEKIFREDQNQHANASRISTPDNIHVRPETKAEIIFNAWNTIFIGKKINIAVDGKIKIVIEKSGENYEIENLSAGERSALYMITKCILAPQNSKILIDETEQHLNVALLNQLWDEIEKARPDCSFIFITHDIDFATSRSDCTSFWIKDFTHPDIWELEKIDTDDIPSEIIFKIIGSKIKKILFCEGEKGCEDLLYQKIYPDFKVIPVGSCTNVIHYTKSLNINGRQDYVKEYFGLIDRDFRSQVELDTLEKNKVFCLGVAEYENLFFAKSLIKFIFEHDGLLDFDTKYSELEKEILKLLQHEEFKKDYFKYQITQQFNHSLKSYNSITDYQFNYSLTDLETKFGVYILGVSTADLALIKLNCKSINGLISKLGFTSIKWKIKILNIFNTLKAQEIRLKFLEIMPTIQ